MLQVQIFNAKVNTLKIPLQELFKNNGS